jgi:hypothetical protein
MMYIPNFVKIGSGIQKLIRGYIDTGWRSHKPTFIFQNKESRLKKVLLLQDYIRRMHKSCLLPAHHCRHHNLINPFRNCQNCSRHLLFGR